MLLSAWVEERGPHAHREVNMAQAFCHPRYLWCSDLQHEIVSCCGKMRALGLRWVTGNQASGHVNWVGLGFGRGSYWHWGP